MKWLEWVLITLKGDRKTGIFSALSDFLQIKEMYSFIFSIVRLVWYWITSVFSFCFMKTTTESLLKLYQKTPEAFFFMVSGSLPIEATAFCHQATWQYLELYCTSSAPSKELRQNLVWSDLRTVPQLWPPPLTAASIQSSWQLKDLLKANVADYWQ